MNAPLPPPASLWQQLNRFACYGCEASFRAIFESHAGLVYQAALRTGHGDRDLAEEVVQTVFTSLARRAQTLSPRIILPAWLHRHACLTTRQMLRTRRRREAREETAAFLHAPARLSNSGDMAEEIDEALDSLPASDRQVLALRYLENQDLRTVGRLLGISDDAAQKRVSRGLERLRLALARRGVVASAALAGRCLAESGTAVLPGAAVRAAAAVKSAMAIHGATAGTGLLTLFAMKPSIVAASIAVLAGTATIPILLSTPPAPEPVAASGAPAAPAARTFPPPGKPSERPRTPIAVKKGTRFPAAPQDPTPAPPYPPEIKEAFQNHPMTKAAEKRVNDMKSVARELLDRMHRDYRETVLRFQALDAKSKDPALPETERAAAKAEAASVAAQAQQMDSGMTEFKLEWEAMIQRNVTESRRRILDEVTHPSPPARLPTPEESAAVHTAESRFLSGDYAAAERDFARLAAGAPPDVATGARWKVLLCRMIQGADHNESVQPLLQGSTSAACYAFAAHSIQQGAWEDAAVWIAKARESGTPSENRLFDDSLHELGWMEPETGLLIPSGITGN